VLDAVCANTEPDCDTQHIIAAALRAVADIIKRSAANSTPSTDWGDGWKDGIRDTARGLLAVATELEQSEPEFTAEEVEMIQAPWSYLSSSQPTSEGD
jgi:hypothetical protein